MGIILQHTGVLSYKFKGRGTDIFESGKRICNYCGCEIKYYILKENNDVS